MATKRKPMKRPVPPKESATSRYVEEIAGRLQELYETVWKDTHHPRDGFFPQPDGSTQEKKTYTELAMIRWAKANKAGFSDSEDAWRAAKREINRHPRGYLSLAKFEVLNAIYKSQFDHALQQITNPRAIRKMFEMDFPHQSELDILLKWAREQAIPFLADVEVEVDEDSEEKDKQDEALRLLKDAVKDPATRLIPTQTTYPETPKERTVRKLKEQAAEMEAKAEKRKG